MRLKDFTEEDLVFVLTGVADKTSFLREIVSRVKSRLEGIDEERLLVRLVEREEEVTTGIGHGVAIPHATVEGLDQTHCVIAQIPEGLDFNALDSSPVHLIFLLISPPSSVGVHLRLLARIARIVSRDKFVYRVATAGSARDIYRLVEEEDGRHV